jgi:rubrerythrin
MEALKALELIENLENDLCGMYEKLRIAFKDDKELSELFSQLTLEEANHANMAKMQKGIVRAKPGDFGEVSLNFTEIRKVMDYIEVVCAIPRNKIGEILLQCYLIESSLVEEYVVLALKESNPEMRNLLEMLGQGFRDHLARFASRVKKEGGDVTNLETIRRHPRVSYSGEAMIDGKVFARGVDVSESGMFLLVATRFADGAVVRVSFPMSGGFVNVEGNVTYSVPNAGIGLAFRNLSETNLALIRAYVDNTLSKVQHARANLMSSQ